MKMGEVLIASEPWKSLSPTAAEMVALFGPPPVLSTEDPIAFWRILEALVAEVEPQDFTEKWLTWLSVVAKWEVMRWRRQKVRALNYSLRNHLNRKAQHEQINQKFGRALPVNNADTGSGSQDADEHVKAAAFISVAKHVAIVDRMENGANARDSYLNREREYHRDSVNSRRREKLNASEGDIVRAGNPELLPSPSMVPSPEPVDPETPPQNS
jgi:hypothetical protein